MVVDAFQLNKEGHTHGWLLPVWCQGGGHISLLN